MKLFIIFLTFISGFCSSLESKVVLEENSAATQSTNLTESIGIEIFGGMFAPIVLKNTQLPTSISNTFSTAGDNQDHLTIAIYRGISKMIKDNTSLGKFKITGFKPELKGVPKIEVTFEVSKNEITLKVKDLRNNNELKLEKL
jgi:molecular chaperone DnaK (HSP70)